MLFRLHDEEVHILYASPNIIRVIKSSRTGCAGHVAHTEEMRNANSVFVGKHEGKNHLEDLGIGGKLILRWM
jgi:hypothetical protein